MRVTYHYKPANTKADLPKGSPYLAMDAFLLSDRVQDVASEAAGDIADAARDLAVAEGHVDTGEYADGFFVDDIVPVGGAGSDMALQGGPRRAAGVFNEAEAAAVMEFGDGRTFNAHHILFRAGEAWDTPRRPR